MVLGPVNLFGNEVVLINLTGVLRAGILLLGSFIGWQHFCVHLHRWSIWHLYVDAEEALETADSTIRGVLSAVKLLTTRITYTIIVTVIAGLLIIMPLNKTFETQVVTVQIAALFVALGGFIELFENPETFTGTFSVGFGVFGALFLWKETSIPTLFNWIQQGTYSDFFDISFVITLGTFPMMLILNSRPSSHSSWATRSKKAESIKESDSKKEAVKTTKETAPTESEAEDTTSTRENGKLTAVEENESGIFNWQQPPEVSFDDIGGYNRVKQELENDVISPLVADSDGYQRFNVEPDKGILFYGPPGTGKTLFARALAHYLNRPFVEISQADIGTKWVNESANMIGQLFAEAQAWGGVVFIDEAETLFRTRRSGDSSGEDSKVTNTFLSELARDDQEFIVILATNRPDLIDDAVKRPGRIDKQVEISEPILGTQVAIFKKKLKGVPWNISEEDLKGICKAHGGLTGAEIEQLVEQARREAAAQNAEIITIHHLKNAG